MWLSPRMIVDRHDCYLTLSSHDSWQTWLLFDSPLTIISQCLSSSPVPAIASVSASRKDYAITVSITGDPKCTEATPQFLIWFDGVQQTGLHESGGTFTVDHCLSIEVKVQYANPTDGSPWGDYDTTTASKCRSCDFFPVEFPAVVIVINIDSLTFCIHMC